MIIRTQIRWLAVGATVSGRSCFRPNAEPRARSNRARSDSVAGKAPPGAQPTGPAQNLSEKLDQSNGVIHPKEVDPAIEKPAPKTPNSNVIPPPQAK